MTRLRELGRHAAEVGVLLSLEMYEDTYLGTADQSVQLVQDIGLANVGINPDIGNLIRLHRPIEDWREMVAKTLPYSNYWHMKNYIRDEDVARDTYVAMPAPMESGLINYREAFKVALSAASRASSAPSTTAATDCPSRPATRTTSAARSCPRPTATPSARARWPRAGSSPPVRRIRTD